MKTILHKAATRGHANHGWLNSFHTFSFAGYYDPQRIHFGALRVLNDDTVAGGQGFGTHPHDNMEIVSIPLSGSLRHKDSMGNTTVITEGEVEAAGQQLGRRDGLGITETSQVNFTATADAKILLMEVPLKW